MDEPDNTFHPEWKRTTIQMILEKCTAHQNSSFQLWLSSHSPIMLSDVPIQSAILLCRDDTAAYPMKKQVPIQRSPFAQQIYALYNDGFILQKGIVGEYATNRIHSLSEQLSSYETRTEKNTDGSDEEILPLIALVEEPLIKGYLYDSYRKRHRIMNGVQSPMNKTGGKEQAHDQASIQTADGLSPLSV